jgi:hypothetical protein
MAFFKKKQPAQDAETDVIQPPLPRNLPRQEEEQVKEQQPEQKEQPQQTIELSGDEILMLNQHREQKALMYKQIHLLQEIKDNIIEVKNTLIEINKKA